MLTTEVFDLESHLCPEREKIQTAKAEVTPRNFTRFSQQVLCLGSFLCVLTVMSPSLFLGCFSGFAHPAMTAAQRALLQPKIYFYTSNVKPLEAVPRLLPPAHQQRSNS